LGGLSNIEGECLLFPHQLKKAFPTGEGADRRKGDKFYMEFIPLPPFGHLPLWGRLS